MAEHLEFGVRGEDLACAILTRSGCRVLSRNWRRGKLELDIVCEGEGRIIFVEVKTRRGDACGGGAAAISPGKKRRLIRAAQAWLSARRMWGRPCRFDVICLTGGDGASGGNFRMEHYRDAFEFSETLGCGDANWQPW